MIYSAIILVLLLALLAGVAYLMITQPPSEYHPRVLSKQEQEIAENRSWKKVDEFYNNINRMEPFMISFDQQMINDLLLLDDVQRFIAKNQARSSGEIRQLQVAFSDDTMMLMGQLRYEGVTSVCSVRLRPRITELGKLQIKLGKIKAGMLRVPEGVVRPELGRFRKVLEEVARRKGEKKNDNDKSVFSKELLDKLVMALSELEKQGQVTVDEKFRAQDKETRLKGIKISEGKIEMVLDSSWLED